MSELIPDVLTTGKSVHFSARDGLRLHARVHGPDNPDLLPVICLPGLSRNWRDFAGLADFLATKAKRKVVTFDYRGRGGSDWDKEWNNYNLLTEADDVIAGMAALGIEHGIFVGTSRGGLITLILSGMRPSLMKAVVLNDIGPVIEGDGLMQIRAYLQRMPKPRSWVEATKYQQAVMEKSFPSFTEAEWTYETHCRYVEKNGKIVADYDPALAKTMVALKATDRLPTLWPQFAGLGAVPVMVIRGEHSSILSQETVEAMGKAHGNLTVVPVAGQGHAPMLHTAGLPGTITKFCAKVG